MAQLKLVPALQKAMKIMSYLSESGERDVSVSEIAAKLSYSKGTTHALLQTLVHYGAAYQDIRTGKYALGNRFLQIAEPYKRKREDTTVFYAVVEQLRLSCKENINYSILRGDQNYVLASVPAEDHVLRVDLPVGSMVPVLVSSAGKVLVSDIDDKALIQIFEKQYKQFTKNTIMSSDEFIRQVREVSRKGFAVNRAEFENGIYSIAAPVKNHAGMVVAAINIVIPGPRFDGIIERRTIDLVKEGARAISERLGEIRKPTAATTSITVASSF
jgi:IclR family transcriptional regulator, KDG regulon repressor